ncbi:MAG: hypothetical protein M1826_004780 [Phylliscum demangeonii]|nr:MAG: hypothetical protein M1826_004780 [Phylliscum demangeonii]
MNNPSPAQPPGQTPSNPSPAQQPGQTPNGVPRKVIVRRRHDNPAPALQTNGNPPAKAAVPGRQPPPALPAPQASKASIATTSALQPVVAKDPHGFSEAPLSAERTVYWPLYTTKRELMEGLRYHAARFTSNLTLDPTDESQFTRPVRLHRRDPRPPQAAAVVGGDGSGAAADSKNDLQEEIDLQEREAQRIADLAQIAPKSARAAAKRMASKKKTRQVFRNDRNPEMAQASKLRYEEALPWHLEDFDNKNNWVGAYEAALSKMHVVLTIGANCFRMYPVEKWYRFTAKNRFKALTLEEAETRMSKKVTEPRWFMQAQKLQAEREEVNKNQTFGRRLFLGKFEEEIGGPEATRARKAELADADELDFEEDRFADDEENQLFEGDAEDAKEAEYRIKRDQLKANVFNLKEEKEYDQESEEEKKEDDLARRLGKGVRKALKKREKNYLYETDSDHNPYSDESSSDDTEEELRKEEERKKGEEKERGNVKETDKEKLVPAAPLKGSTTPSGRHKPSDAPKKAASSLKRPGSPIPSDASGAESARKKAKKKHSKSSQATATSTPLPAPASRAASPAPPSSATDKDGPPAAKPRAVVGAKGGKAAKTAARAATPSTIVDKKKRVRTKPGSGSDGDATGGEMSDPGPLKANKRARPSPLVASARASRAGSPNPASVPVQARQGSAAAQTSRAGSPAVRPEAVRAPSDPEIIGSIPVEGTTISALLAKFKNRVGNKDAFISQIKRLSFFDRTARKLHPKVPGAAAPSAAAPAAAATPAAAAPPA